MTTKVMLSFPEEFLTEVDRLAKQEHRSRSELVREALRLYIGFGQARRVARTNPLLQQALAVQDGLSRLSPGTGEDSTTDVQRWREARG
jgi:Arc/MetJ-type ribon-helix-helix transcriptional regulator